LAVDADGVQAASGKAEGSADTGAVSADPRQVPGPVDGLASLAPPGSWETCPSGNPPDEHEEMTAMPFKNDMTMMYVMHDALRRDLDSIARVTARPDDDPGHILRAAAGWQMFASYLQAHHTTEDDMLWPLMRAALADNSDGVALLDAMEAEHAAIDPLLAAIDAALADRESGPQRLGELTDALAIALRGHLDHEEAEGLALIDATVTEQQWQAFRAEGGRRVAGDVHRYMPWLLDGASPDITAMVLGMLPPAVRQTYRDEWQPAFAGLTLWTPPVPGSGPQGYGQRSAG
jgi:hemerythrin-like domain-containing protein